VLRNDYRPCLILIDEWVAYARQLHDEGDLPVGSFETHFTFAQALTEAAKLARYCLLVICRAALARLRNVIGRVESSWAPASTEEGFEIVRRRLHSALGYRSPMSLEKENTPELATIP
jgi:hypothetical protein